MPCNVSSDDFVAVAMYRLDAFVPPPQQHQTIKLLGNVHRFCLLMQLSVSYVYHVQC